MKSPPLAGFLHFKGLISNIQKLYWRFKGLLIQETRSMTIETATVILRVSQSKSPSKRR